MMSFSLFLDAQKFLSICIESHCFICNQVNFAKSVIVNISHCELAVQLTINVVMA